MDRRLIVIPLGIVLSGAMGGLALGGYVTGRSAAATTTTTQESWWSTEASAADTSAMPAVPEAAADNAPERYVCHGCGPTLAERQAQSYATDYASAGADYGKDDLAPLPAYQPASLDDDTQVHLPELDASHSVY